MRDIRTKIATTAIAAALIFSPTAAVASSYSAQSPSNAWVTLSEMTPAGATALAGSGVVSGAPDAATLAAAQTTVVATDSDYRPNPLPLPVIAVLLAVLGGAIYIALIEKHHSHRPFLISPA